MGLCKASEYCEDSASGSINWASIFMRRTRFQLWNKHERGRYESSRLPEGASLYCRISRRGEQVARLLMSGIMAAGTLSGLLLLKMWFDASIMIPVLFYVCAAPLGYIGLYLSIRSFFGSLSERKTSGLLGVSTTFLGALVGILFPPLFTIVFLFALSF